MAKPVLGKSKHSDCFFLGREFAVRTISMETVQAVQRRQILNLHATKTAKENVNIVILHSETIRES